MKTTSKHLALTALRLVLGIEILLRSCTLAFSPRAAEAFARMGWPNALRLALAWSEIVATVLFLLPGTLAVGAWSLIVVFLGAVTLHVVHGEFDVGGLLVFAVAALVVLTHQASRTKLTVASSPQGVP
jgi:uncharacterized membrane protein YphA (DoxX/SURF4 family)